MTFGHLNENEIDEILAQNYMGRIGCHYNDVTYVVPISYAYDGQYIYSISCEGMKLQMLRQNPEVCFEVDEVKDMLNWKSVIVWGHFEELSDHDQRNEVLDMLRDSSLLLVSSVTTHRQPAWPFIGRDFDKLKGVLFRIELRKKTGRFERNSGVADQLPRATE